MTTSFCSKEKTLRGWELKLENPLALQLFGPADALSLMVLLGSFCCESPKWPIAHGNKEQGWPGSILTVKKKKTKILLEKKQMAEFTEKCKSSLEKMFTFTHNNRNAN